VIRSKSARRIEIEVTGSEQCISLERIDMEHDGFRKITTLTIPVEFLDICTRKPTQSKRFPGHYESILDETIDPSIQSLVIETLIPTLSW
jgi:hypothetical protein